MRVMALALLTGFRALYPRISPSCRIHVDLTAMKNHVPERWTEYTCVGKRIPGTRFIAFKVPLKKLFDNRLAPHQRFSASDLISEIKEQNEELGLVVDLTCTRRYYAPQELPPTIKYAKIFTVGQQVPTDDVIHEFNSIVKQFLSENSDNDKLVGVHCTHGLNRTGYLVCRYMVDVLGMVPSEAIEKFNKSRGHCMERENYLDDLLQGKPRSQPSSNRDWVPRSPAPPISPLPGPHIPGSRRNFHQMVGRPPSFDSMNAGAGIPPPIVPHLYMPEPRHHNPYMKDNQQLHFRRGPQEHRHYPNGYFTDLQDDGPVNGAHMWHFAPWSPHKYGGPMVNYTGTRGSSRQVYERNGPYSRWPEQGRRWNPGQQWQ